MNFLEQLERIASEAGIPYEVEHEALFITFQSTDETCQNGIVHSEGELNDGRELVGFLSPFVLLNNQALEHFDKSFYREILNENYELGYSHFVITDFFQETTENCKELSVRATSPLETLSPREFRKKIGEVTKLAHNKSRELDQDIFTTFLS